ncbi:hypothetical protein C9I98_09015 [Photobacterium sanctipauli]|uniref:Chalcone isomerase domain-containing protein n=1 Tax=Photobacterium sanctipauli TaxID=1342794 RepID=A0A2T3NV79_9GAMM|nr:hypothetical protein [Photobacterium sanctipauli]PSW20186.1 hypothetical protein C9I98_09015 [Photobacterium sanctipauli]
MNILSIVEFKRMLVTMLLLLVVFLPAGYANSSSPWQTWPAVGDAQLKWGPWVIYDSELRSPSGLYSNTIDDLALVIKYQRNIDNEDLLEATDDQWQHLGVNSVKRKQWVNELGTIWPDVKKGDRLIFVLRNGEGHFYRDNWLIGSLSSEEMSISFLEIWLSPKTAYPEIRRQLIGMNQ